VSRRVPIELLELVGESVLEEPPRLLSSLSMSDARTDCAVLLDDAAALDEVAAEAVVAALKRLDRVESELLLTLPIDIMRRLEL
jgi:hypothetical protein